MEVEETRVLVEQTAVTGVGRKEAPLIIADHGPESGALRLPARATPDGVLLGLLLLVAVAAERRGVAGGRGA